MVGDVKAEDRDAFREGDRKCMEEETDMMLEQWRTSCWNRGGHDVGTEADIMLEQRRT
jgi:hypothetical protein